MMDCLYLPWYPEEAVVDVGGDMSTYLDCMTTHLFSPAMNMDVWWFDQRIPGYRFCWKDIDRRGIGGMLLLQQPCTMKTCKFLHFLIT